VGLDVFDADGTRISTSNQAPEKLAGQEQIIFEAVHQLRKIKTCFIQRSKPPKNAEFHLCRCILRAYEERVIRQFTLFQGLHLQTPHLQTCGFERHFSHAKSDEGLKSSTNDENERKNQLESARFFTPDTNRSVPVVDCPGQSLKLGGKRTNEAKKQLQRAGRKNFVF